MVQLEILSVMAAAAATGAARRWPQAGWKWWELTVPFLCSTVIAWAMLLLRFGPVPTVTTATVCWIILLYASWADYQCREVDDWVHVLLILAGLVHMELSQLPYAVGAAILVAVMMLLVTIWSSNSIGGADIKLTAAFTFGTGIWCGLTGLMLGALGAIIHQVQKENRWNQSFPLIPYLTIGFALSFLLSGGK